MFPFDSRSNCFLTRGPFGWMRTPLDSERYDKGSVGNEQGKVEEEGRDEEEEDMGQEQGIGDEDKDKEEDKGLSAEAQDRDKGDSIYFDPNHSMTHGQGNHSSDVREEEGACQTTDER